MKWLPLILYVSAIIFLIYTQIQSNKDLKNVGAVLGGLGALILIGMMIFDFGSKGIKKGAEYPICLSSIYKMHNCSKLKQFNPNLFFLDGTTNKNQTLHDYDNINVSNSLPL